MSVGPAALPRLLAGLDPSGSPMTLAEHERIHGPLPRRSPAELIEAVERSGLRGRGGADFPTARKLQSVARGRRGAVLVVNGSETEPASGKDRLLLSRLPHLVLDGAVLAAGAIGARRGVREGRRACLGLDPGARERDRRPLRRQAANPGRDRSRRDTSPARSARSSTTSTAAPRSPRSCRRCRSSAGSGAGRRWCRTRRRWPRSRSSPATASGGTASSGRDADPGSALVTISGAVAAPGVYELAFGTPMIDLLAAAGGSTEPLRALLVGGYFGTWVDASSAFRSAARAGGPPVGRVLARLGRADRARSELVRAARERSRDRLSRRSVGAAVRPVHVRIARDRRFGRRDRRRRRRLSRGRAGAPLGQRGPRPRRLSPSRRRGAVHRERAGSVLARDRGPPPLALHGSAAGLPVAPAAPRAAQLAAATRR